MILTDDNIVRHRFQAGNVPAKIEYEEKYLIDIEYEGSVPENEDFADYYVPKKKILGSVIA